MRIKQISLVFFILCAYYLKINTHHFKSAKLKFFVFIKLDIFPVDGLNF